MCITNMFIYIYSSSGYKSQPTFGRHGAARQQDCMANVFIFIPNLFNFFYITFVNYCNKL